MNIVDILTTTRLQFDGWRKHDFEQFVWALYLDSSDSSEIAAAYFKQLTCYVNGTRY